MSKFQDWGSVEITMKMDYKETCTGNNFSKEKW